MIQKGGILTNLIVFFGIIAVVIFVAINSNSAKPGDIHYPIDQTLEVMTVTFDKVAPEEKIVADSGFASERLEESYQLYIDGKDDLALETVKKYQSLLARLGDSTDNVKSRAAMTVQLKSEFIDYLVKDLETLVNIYMEAPSDQSDQIETIIRETYSLYQTKIENLQALEGIDNPDILTKKDRVYIVEQSLSAYGMSL